MSKQPGASQDLAPVRLRATRSRPACAPGAGAHLEGGHRARARAPVQCGLVGGPPRPWPPAVPRPRVYFHADRAQGDAAWTPSAAGDLRPVYAYCVLGAPPENGHPAGTGPHSEGKFWDGPTAGSRQVSAGGRAEAPARGCPLAVCPMPPRAPPAPCPPPGHALGDGGVRAALRGECRTPRTWAA